jgi:hypothetical protein
VGISGKNKEEKLKAVSEIRIPNGQNPSII